ncbi:MAG: helix-turn-helix transcriptional regulator [Pseudomonadota bacterium]
MSPAQCRAARALLGMTQTALADAAGVNLSTVVDFERERRKVSYKVLERLLGAFHEAGVDFIDGNGGGPGVRLRGQLD